MRLDSILFFITWKKKKKTTNTNPPALPMVFQCLSPLKSSWAMIALEQCLMFWMDGGEPPGFDHLW